MMGFNKYLLKLGTLLGNYSYTIDDIVVHIDYFNGCYEEDLSPYKSLEMFYYHLNKNGYEKR